jgi:hypothetical protein
MDFGVAARIRFFFPRGHFVGIACSIVWPPRVLGVLSMQGGARPTGGRHVSETPKTEIGVSWGEIRQNVQFLSLNDSAKRSGKHFVLCFKRWLRGKCLCA